MARNFQTQITSTKVLKSMKASFATEDKARGDIARSVIFSQTADGQEHWGDIVSAVIFNKETGKTTTVI
jgi:hypothetical protein